MRDRDDLKAWRRSFEEQGVDHSEIKETGPGASMITLRGPDNIQLEGRAHIEDEALVERTPHRTVDAVAGLGAH